MLGRIPAPTRFVSAEPLLGALDLTEWLNDGTLHWVIAGGESGVRARPMKLDWARALRDQSLDAGVAFFLKQLGGRRGKRSGPDAVVDGQTWGEMPESEYEKGTRIRLVGAQTTSTPPPQTVIPAKAGIQSGNPLPT